MNGLSFANEILALSQRSPKVDVFLAAAVPLIAAQVQADAAVLASAASGRWTALNSTGAARSLPSDLLAAAADAETVQANPRWIAAPQPGNANLVLLLHTKADTNSDQVEIAVSLAAVFFDGLAAVTQRVADRQRVDRLAAALEMAKSWAKTNDVPALLASMAEAATRMFATDRATIFLWDRTSHTLVGRPALGLPNGELRIPDNRGVVGRVIKTGQPCRVDAAMESELIDRQVDAQTGYRTRNLLCVPLRGASNELVGAFELINRLAGPFTADDEAGLVEIADLAAVAIENVQNRQQLLAVTRQIADQAAERVRLIGQSPAIAALRSVIQRVAATELAVLILGENGTGKEVVAKAIHYQSDRRDKPFIAINCAAIPESLAESELFGHEKGAFTDAHEARPGKFELAAGGTLFLDEIGELSVACQAKLLRVLEEKTLVRVGGSTPIHTDARVIAATNQNLAEMVRHKRFREDLYFRLNVVTLELPPLRSRRDDILLLATHFLADFCARARRRTPEFSPEARVRLEQHPWPGNVRELRNLMERLAYLGSAERIEADELAFILSPSGGSPLAEAITQPLADATDQFQTEYIRRAIRESNGNMSDAAQRLGLHRSNLYRKMRMLGMKTP